MRRLLWVPVMHEPVDLGSAGEPLARRTASLVGERRWALHQATTERFWDSIGAYLYSLDTRTMRVYQEGLVAEGALGRHIVEEAARRGSRNYRLVLELVARGAQLQKTEDLALLQREHEGLAGLLQQGDVGWDEPLARPAQEAQARLTEERDLRVAQGIDATLQEGETGVLFMGARHGVGRFLPQDMAVVELKERSRVIAYWSALLQGDDETVGVLARCLGAPVDALH